MSAPITVLICVGPEPKHQTYLQEALDSAFTQTVKPDEILLIDDMANLDEAALAGMAEGYKIDLRVWRAPWNLGTSCAVNCGIGLAHNECVVLLASDDYLNPGVVERCQKEYIPGKLAYYWFEIQMFGLVNERMTVPSGASMVTKSLWKYTGGYPSESSVGHSDSILVNIMQVHCPEVEFIPAHCLYNARILDENDFYVRQRGGWDPVIAQVKQLCTDNWRAPAWGRF